MKKLFKSQLFVTLAGALLIGLSTFGLTAYTSSALHEQRQDVGIDLNKNNIDECDNLRVKNNRSLNARFDEFNAKNGSSHDSLEHKVTEVLIWLARIEGKIDAQNER